MDLCHGNVHTWLLRAGTETDSMHGKEMKVGHAQRSLLFNNAPL